MSTATKREALAEFLGTFVLIVFGVGVNAQVTLSKTTVSLEQGAALSQFDHGDWLSINIGWGLAVALAVYVAGGVSGAHINPAVTIMLAATRRFPWSKAAPYIVAQFAGALAASAVVFLVYREALDALDPTGRTMNTAGIWATYPRSFADGRILTNLGGLIDQIVGTALLAICVLAIGDERNIAPKANLAPLAVGATVIMIGIAFGANCGYAINPARDLSPRVFTALAGWGGQVFQQPNATWWLVPIAGPLIGGVLGAVGYDQLIGLRHPAGGDAALDSDA